MSWDLQDIGAHMMERHGFDRYPAEMPSGFIARDALHAQDHADPIGMGHEHDPKDLRIIKEV